MLQIKLVNCFCQNCLGNLGLSATHSYVSPIKIQYLIKEIIVALQEGANVELGDLCIFYPAVQIEGVDNEADFNTAAHIKRKTIKIRPKQKLSRQMAEVPVQRTS